MPFNWRTVNPVQIYKPVNECEQKEAKSGINHCLSFKVRGARQHHPPTAEGALIDNGKKQICFCHCTYVHGVFEVVTRFAL